MIISNNLTRVLVTVIASLMLLLPAIMLTSSVNAQEDEQQPQPITAVNSDEPEAAVEGSYTFIAQPGDSYSKIARKAVQIYGIETETNLSLEQIMFAETNLTIQAGSPELAVGQEVIIQKSDVANWVDKAKELSDSQQALWTKYVAGANFNTNSVGE